MNQSMTFLRGCCIAFFFVLLWGCSSPKGVYHTVQNGQTLYQISKSYKVDEKYLARVNNIHDPTKISVGQRVFIPGATKRRYVPATVSTKKKSTTVKTRKSSTKKTTKAVQKTTTPKTTRPAKVAKPKTTTKKASTQNTPKAKKGIFTWPLKGKIVKKFGGKGAKSSNGIEIAARKGSHVTSAAAGKVIYSGNGISGYGNLIILQHDDAYYSVYGFNQRNLVDSGGFVSKGQKIALSGAPPSGGTPRLYFEVRYGKRPVNPIFYLP